MSKRKFLWLLPYFPYPILSGGNVRVFNLIKHLSEEYDIHLISFVEDGVSEEEIKEVSKYCASLKAIKRIEREGPLPMIFQCYETEEMTAAITEALKEDYDFVQLDFLTMAHYARLVRVLSSAPLVFTEHDVSWLDFDKCFHNRHLDERARYAEWIRIVRKADTLYDLFDLVITVSELDAEIVRKRYPGKRVVAVPTGTDCSHYTYEKPGDKTDLIYT
ncbi:MAG: glycosyltransferase family 4 protein, partial [Elusimicrobia bacterium]|nr:glycosyltransferase family 4 protein [Elusimicrobiota bacterium]